MRCSTTSVSEVDWQMAPVGDDLAAQRQAVGEIAVMGNGDAADFKFGKQRLHVAQRHFAGGRIARVADGDGRRAACARVAGSV